MSRKNKRLNRSFFNNKTTLELAQALLGKVLVHKSPAGIIKGIINETEAYSQDEESCHAFGGKRSKRNEVIFWRAGHMYVYFTYGMHYCINIVTGEPDRAEAVLIRSVLPLEGQDIMLLNRKGRQKNLADGPAKLAMAYGFDKAHNGVDLLDGQSAIYLEDQGYKPEAISQTERIGISKAKELPWRFVCSKCIQ